MSRIGKKPIAIPKGVTVTVDGNTVRVQGPKGKVDTPLPSGIKLEQKDGNLLAVRDPGFGEVADAVFAPWLALRSEPAR